MKSPSVALALFLSLSNGHPSKGHPQSHSDDYHQKPPEDYPAHNRVYNQHGMPTAKSSPQHHGPQHYGSKSYKTVKKPKKVSAKKGKKTKYWYINQYTTHPLYPTRYPTPIPSLPPTPFPTTEPTKSPTPTPIPTPSPTPRVPTYYPTEYPRTNYYGTYLAKEEKATSISEARKFRGVMKVICGTTSLIIWLIM